MASTDQDRRRRTLPLQTHEDPRQAAPDPEVLDGEIVDEDGPELSDERAPRHPGQPPTSRHRTRGERAQKRRPQAVDPMVQLRREIDAAGRRYMLEVRKADLLVEKKTPRESNLQLTGIHKGYVSMMILSCIQPLSEGINAKSVLSTVGMGSAMWMMSPNFRAQVGDFQAQMKDAITQKIDDRRQGQIDKVLSKAGSGAAADEPLSQRWQKKLERAERAQRGGRDVYTAQSAAMTEVALVENAYAAMRAEDADVDGINDRLSSMLTGLYGHAHEDGVDATEIATQARIIVGMRLQDEPELASVFGELAHGQFARSDAREVKISGTDTTAQVWTGEFESRLGQRIEAGSFGVRTPMGESDHQASIADTMTTDMISLTRQHGVDGLNLGVVSYASAWGLKDRPDYEAMAAMDNPLGERLRVSGLMRHTMGADGIGLVDQQRIYSNAYVDAMENISAMYPEVEQEWAAKFGDNWRQNMRDFVSDPQTYMGQPENQGATSTDEHGEWEAEPSAWEAGPASPSGQEPYSHPAAHPAEPPANPSATAARKYRNARINQNYVETSKTGVHGMGSDPSDHRDQDFELGG